MYQHQNQIQRE